jgi:hypothetical protein
MQHNNMTVCQRCINHEGIQGPGSSYLNLSPPSSLKRGENSFYPRFTPTRTSLGLSMHWINSSQCDTTPEANS